jgi:hypothetical protein
VSLCLRESRDGGQPCSCAVCVTVALASPSTTKLPANTMSPSAKRSGVLSPVTGDVSTARARPALPLPASAVFPSNCRRHVERVPPARMRTLRSAQSRWKSRPPAAEARRGTPARPPPKTTARRSEPILRRTAATTAPSVGREVDSARSRPTTARPAPTSDRSRLPAALS